MSTASSPGQKEPNSQPEPVSQRTSAPDTSRQSSTDYGRQSQTFDPALVAKPKVGLLDEQLMKITTFIGDLGICGGLSYRTFVTFFQRPFELRAIIYQFEVLGVASTAIACITALFIGMVMAIQFAFGLQKFGGMEYVGRVIGLSFTRELAPTLTAIIVGGRVGAGMAAEVGSMNVTEQVDAIRALGADPVKKLVMPRIVACTLVMPVLSFFALALGFTGAMIITSIQFGISMPFFFRSALESTQMRDVFAGMGKTPFFGFLIALIGCHFGLKTKGGTEGVGRSTTSTVVVISITILIADFFLTKLFLSFFP